MPATPPRWKPADQVYEALPLGRATAGTGSVLGPEEALAVLDDLDKAR